MGKQRLYFDYFFDLLTNDHGAIDTPLLYLRGEFESGDIDEYANGFQTVGISSLTRARIPGSGHYTPEENPEAVWAEVARFIGVDVNKKPHKV